ncbi:MAG: hypothetical protein ACO1OQ_12920 [Rufibacter sp.]
MKTNLLAAFILAALGVTACDGSNTTTSTTDRPVETGHSQGVPEKGSSPTSATSSAGGGGMSGATSTHALAADSTARDSLR